MTTSTEGHRAEGSSASTARSALRGKHQRPASGQSRPQRRHRVVAMRVHDVVAGVVAGQVRPQAGGHGVGLTGDPDREASHRRAVDHLHHGQATVTDLREHLDLVAVRGGPTGTSSTSAGGHA
jgi:hypothetical protein